MDKTLSPYNPSIAIHPGTTLRDELEFLNISQIEFAEKSGLSKNDVKQILHGELAITYEIAIGIAKALVGTPPAEFWEAKQRSYEFTVTRLKNMHASQKTN